MANIKITVDGPLMDGHKITFKAPCSCMAVEKLDVRYVEDNTQKSRLFTMKDSHGNNLTGLGNLFSEGAYVNVVLDTNFGFAYLQNADTNAYIEGMLRASDGTPFRFGVTEDGEYGYIVTDEEGADTVHPFKNLVRDTQATATSADITLGFTAWVNGELIVGTRPAPEMRQEGSLGVGHDDLQGVYTYTIVFPKKFDTVPTVVLNTDDNDLYTEIVSVTEGQCVFNLYNTAHKGQYATVTWVAYV